MLGNWHYSDLPDYTIPISNIGEEIISFSYDDSYYMKFCLTCIFFL